ncbi:MAG: hypothetical protein JSS61_03035 [Verrucomicrobia bacterium]|nr:hypothetical protein [Verrucomicrobiota bacterium]
MNPYTLKNDFTLRTGGKADRSEGERALLRGDLAQGLEYFDSSLKQEGESGELFYNQGLALLEFGREEGREKALLYASRKFKAATTLSPDSFEAWFGWGSALCALGVIHGAHHYFLTAKEKLKRAVSLADKQGRGTLAKLHWEIGIVHLHLGQHSGEALELHLAIEAFHAARSQDEKLPGKFWKDYGKACVELAAQINDPRFYSQAIQYFREAISLDKDPFEGWHLLAKALQQLYHHTHDEEHFSQANDCFGSASQLRPHDANLWLEWAEFLCDSAKRVSDIKRLRLCIEKCHRAQGCDPESSRIRALWGEALALLGDYSDRLDLLCEGQNKILEALDDDDTDPAIWYSYGICLKTFGHYYNEVDYYYQAIEKFQQGLSIDRTCHRHWHAIGHTYALLGGMENDPATVELSFRFFQKAIDLHFSTHYLFDYGIALSKLGQMQHSQHALEAAINQFDEALRHQKNALYLHPEWLFHYACALDALGDFHDDEELYLRAIDTFSQVLMIDPDFYVVHHRLALALSHLGELMEETEHFVRAQHHFRLALRTDEENDGILLDWAVTLINLADHSINAEEAAQAFRDAEQKLFAAMRLGNSQSYYHLACLYSLMGRQDCAMRHIEKALSFCALPPLEELLQDEWLSNLRMTEEFQNFIALLEQKRRAYQEER